MGNEVANEGSAKSGPTIEEQLALVALSFDRLQRRFDSLYHDVKLMESHLHRPSGEIVFPRESVEHVRRWDRFEGKLDVFGSSSPSGKMGVGI